LYSWAAHKQHNEDLNSFIHSWEDRTNTENISRSTDGYEQRIQFWSSAITLFYAEKW